MVAKYEDFANRRFHVTNRSGDEYMVRCVFHNDSRASMQFNVESGLFICFAGNCGASGGIKTLERHLGIRVQENLLDVRDIMARLDSLKNPEAEVLPFLDESYLGQFDFPTNYWTDDRGFTPTTVAAFDLGYSPLGDKYGEFMSIPIRDMAGRLLGIIKRYTDHDAELRYKYPKGFHRNQNLFGSWMAEQDPEAYTVALVEGSIDAIKCWQATYPALAVYGSSISPSQVRILRRLGVRKVVLFPDDDEAGDKFIDACRGWHQKKRGNKKTWHYDPMTDLRREFLVEKAWYSRGLPSDPGAMNSEQIELVMNTTRKMF